MNNRQMMQKALEAHTFAQLYSCGFTGKYPNFRRHRDDCIELITFQNNKWGGAFTVEASAVFPYSTHPNYKLYEGVTEESFGVEATNHRYRLPGMFDGWFYTRDVYCKRTLFLGKHYYIVSEKEAAEFIPPKGYKLVQKFNCETAVQICKEINKQLEKAYQWLEVFERENSR